MTHDALSNRHPAVSFLFFILAIGFGVVIQHPAYLLAGAVCAGSYYLLLNGRSGWRMICGLVPVFVLLSAINPLFNTYGATVLFCLFGRPFTLEALLYGMVISGMLVEMLLWFGCYSAVMTSDKFTSLFGNLIPALSLLLVMVLRMIPGFIRKAGQISGVRKCIGKSASEESGVKERIADGMSVLSALMDWALEGSITTGDSMRARGYGSAPRTSFQIYHMTGQDWVLIACMATLAAAVILGGEKTAAFSPEIRIAPLSFGFAAYCILLLIPSALHIKEAIQWHISRSAI